MGACGATLATFFAGQPNEIGLPLGTLDDDPGVRPSAHVFVASKAPWFEIADGLPQFSEGIGIVGDAERSDEPVQPTRARGGNEDASRRVPTRAADRPRLGETNKTP